MHHLLFFMKSKSSVLEMCKWSNSDCNVAGTMLDLENEQIVKKDLQLIFVTFK